MSAKPKLPLWRLRCSSRRPTWPAACWRSSGARGRAVRASISSWNQANAGGRPVSGGALALRASSRPSGVRRVSPLSRSGGVSGCGCSAQRVRVANHFSTVAGLSLVPFQWAGKSLSWGISHSCMAATCCLRSASRGAMGASQSAISAASGWSAVAAGTPSWMSWATSLRRVGMSFQMASTWARVAAGSG